MYAVGPSQYFRSTAPCGQRPSRGAAGRVVRPTACAPSPPPSDSNNKPSNSDNGNGSLPKFPKGSSFENSKRRRGRPATSRSPDDTPLRDGNRDRLIGLLTERAVKTLLVYLMETNLAVYHWLGDYLRAYPIPRAGESATWDEVSGDAFLRALLAAPVQSASFALHHDGLQQVEGPVGVDPRQIAQRIMDIRAQLAIEFIQDLQGVRQENSELLRETLTASFAFSDDALAAAGSSSEDESGGSGGDGTAGGGSGAGGFMHPELAEALAEQRAAAAIKAALEPNDKTKKPRGPNEP